MVSSGRHLAVALALSAAAISGCTTSSKATRVISVSATAHPGGPTANELKDASRYVLLAKVRPGVDSKTVFNWMTQFGRPSVDDEPGMKETTQVHRSFRVLFYANATAAQREHARQQLLRSGLFEHIRWTLAKR